MANIFNKVKVSKTSSNVFDMSHDVKLSLNMGKLTPTTLIECIPGDKFNISTESLLRFAPLISPVMHNINVYTHYFFVPNRLVWDNWEKFITANNGSDIIPAPPVFSTLQNTKNKLGDYFGLPIGAVDDVSAIPFAAYNLIYNEFYRDQNLQNEIGYKLNDGTDNGHIPDALKNRAWQHDYFTSALPFAQKGEPVSLPLGDFQDVAVVRKSPTGLNTIWANTTPAGSQTIIPTGNPSGFQNDALYAETSDLSAGSATINDLRRAFRLQEWLEKMARGGSRYIEQIKMHFGVSSSDARLQRPEFLGGHKQPVVISEVLQTSETAETPQGTMAGHALSASSGKNISFSCEEHGYIIGIMSIMPKTAYQQGVPKHFTRKSYLDYAWPTFAHIGEQEILNKEVYNDKTDDKNDDVFGYIPRYQEYRYLDSRVAGDFRDSLAFWHLGRIFENRPLLNGDFIECKPDDRIFAVGEQIYEQNIWAHCYHRIRAVRKLPKYGTPTL